MKPIKTTVAVWVGFFILSMSIFDSPDAALGLVCTFAGGVVAGFMARPWLELLRGGS